jgi:formylglycine-generating enzyme required for sulfatase activity
MHGNVGEWVLDYWQDHLGYESICDPVGLSSGSMRVVKGGNRTDSVTLCRSAMRSAKNINRRSGGIFGFRVACVVD